MFKIERFFYRKYMFLILILCTLSSSNTVLTTSVYRQNSDYSQKLKDHHSENILESKNNENNVESKTDLNEELDTSTQDILGLSRLVNEAEIVHSKLKSILSDYYFRIYRVNLDSSCRSKPRLNSCSSQKNFINLNTNRFNSHNNRSDSQNVSQYFSSHTNGNNGQNNHNGKENGSGIQKCHVDRCNSSEIPFNVMGSKRENYVLRFSESSLANNGFSNLGFDLSFFDQSPFVSDNYSFVDLLKNPPSYTGYNGQDDWKLINSEIEKYDSLSCKESLHFYKLISGMRSTITAFSALNYECVNPVEAYEDRTELPMYQSNYHYYNNKLSQHKDWMENIYYTYKYILSSVIKLNDYLQYYNSHLHTVNNQLYLKLKDFLCFTYTNSTTTKCDCKFNNTKDKKDSTSGDSKSEDCCGINIIDSSCGPEILQKFDRLIQLIDCVDCEKCRLHGKLKLSAIQTAIKILTWPNDKLKELQLDRNELVALFHGLDYFAQSILIIERFEQHKKRQIMLYPLRFLLGCLLFIIVVYRRELISLTNRVKFKSN